MSSVAVGDDVSLIAHVFVDDGCDEKYVEPEEIESLIYLE